jgi:hypothetical protein
MVNMCLKKSNYYILLFWLMFLGSYSYGQKLECPKFANGSFKIVDSETGTSFIKRYGTRQSEITEGRKDSTIFIVKWIDDCTYTLIPTEETRKKYPSLPDNAMLTVRIIETKDKSYIQTSTSNFYDTKATNEVIKIQ